MKESLIEVQPKKKNYDQPNKQLDKGFLFKKLHAKSLKLR